MASVLWLAVRRLPPPYYRADGARLAQSLKARRDGLEAVSRRIYELLAREPEVHGTDASDALQILRRADGAVDVVLTGASGPYFRRRFLPDETSEVRVFLKGGDDRALSEGSDDARVTLRVVGGKGRDVLDDGAGHTRFYDADDDTQVADGRDTKTFTKHYPQPLDDQGNPQRDWGRQSRIVPWARASVDYGLVLGAAFQRIDYGFRKHPYASRHVLRAGYSTSLQTGGVEYAYESLRTDSRSRLQVAAKASALDLIHYFGFGNESSDVDSKDIYRVRVTQYAFLPAYRFEMSGADVWLGPALKYADTHEDPGTLLAEQQPYGTNKFGQVGARAELGLDRRAGTPDAPEGLLLSVGGAVYPAVWSVSETFGRVEGEGTAYLTAPLPLRPTLALRAGGRTAGYYKTTTGSLGLQLGAQSKAIVIGFMTEPAYQHFLRSDGWTAGADAGVALLKVGANGRVDTSTATEPVVGFVLTNSGLMFNLSIQGTKVAKLAI